MRIEIDRRTSVDCAHSDSEREVSRFDLRTTDAAGRALGLSVATFARVATQVPDTTTMEQAYAHRVWQDNPGVSFGFRGSVLKDGTETGNSGTESLYTTREERDRAARRYVNDACRRYGVQGDPVVARARMVSDIVYDSTKGRGPYLLAVDGHKAYGLGSGTCGRHADEIALRHVLNGRIVAHVITLSGERVAGWVRAL